MTRTLLFDAMTTIKQKALRIRAWMRTYERYVVPIALVSGFVIDTQVFTRVDVLWNDLLLFGFIVAAAVGITLFNMGEERILRGWVTTAIASAMPLVVQFAFGSLFKGLIIFYGRSASLTSSWVFVFTLAALLIFSEVFINNYRRFRYQMVLLFLFVLLYNAFYLPVVLGSIGPVIFLLSIAVSLAMVGVFAFALGYIIPKRLAETRPFLIRAFLAIAAGFIILYALNVIPPLPLALKDEGVLHSLTRVGDTYQATYEQDPWYDWLPTYAPVFHEAPGDTVYIYTALFVPTKIRLTLKHEWQRYDTASKRWTTTDIVSFPVAGGRDGGYRGYSKKSGLAPGAWRVNVITDYGAIISRIDFSVEAVDTPVPVIEATY